MSLEADIDLAVGGLQLQVALSAGDQEVVAVLGPQGSGKTTLLRALAGLIRLRAGHVTLDGQLLEDTKSRVWTPPEKRSIGILFQEQLLFPHLNVLDNVAFGLQARGMSRNQAQAEVVSWLARMDLATWAAQVMPATLSAGQAQRVALLRALVTSPRLLVLDEPLAKLDVSTRAAVRRDLRERLAEFQGSRLILTHNPLEAMALADRVVILEGGRVIQTGSPVEITARPRSQYVADLVGLNIYRGQTREDGLVQLSEGARLAVSGVSPGEVLVTIHPRAVSLWRQQPDGTPRNVWRGVASGLELFGDRVRTRIDADPSIVAEVTPDAVAALRLDEGGEVWISVKATEIEAYPA